MKQAMFHYYLDLATLRKDRTYIQSPVERAFTFYEIAASGQFRTMVRDLANQPIKNEIIETCIGILDTTSDSQIDDFAAITIELDKGQQENQRFGLYALTMQKDGAGIHRGILKEWIKSNSFSLDLF